MIMIQFISLVVGFLAVYRITLLLTSEDGPYNVFTKLRKWAGITQVDLGDGVPVLMNTKPNSLLAGILECFYCCSVWVGIGVTLIMLTPIGLWILMPFSLSAAAIIIMTITEG